MRVKHWCAATVAALVGGTNLFGQTLPAPTAVSAPAVQLVPGSQVIMMQEGQPAAPEGGTIMPDTRAEASPEAASDAPPAFGPTPLLEVKLLQNWLRDCCGKQDELDENGKPKPRPYTLAAWIDMDYTYRSTGNGNNPIAPVMNHFGNEFLNRSNGVFLSKNLDPKSWSWGFNMILIAGSDASFLNPTEGWFESADLGPGGSSRYSIQFTDLNFTVHAPILTEGGVDIKAGRQTTILGPMGALPWQRWFDSSDYAWYNLEEGRYTGVSAIWHVNKQLDWYNGFELGWGTFFAQIPHCVDYITNISYWLDEDAKKTKVWTTVLTGPTSRHSGKFTTTFELGLQHNWDERWYQIVDTQMTWSKGPVNAEVPPGYNENAYDIYTYLGYHVNKEWDMRGRFEWYYDQNGLSYAGGFGVPETYYYALTVGPDYHPTTWLQFRPELRYDYATKPNFGEHFNKQNQVSVAAEVLLKF